MSMRRVEGKENRSNAFRTFRRASELLYYVIDVVRAAKVSKFVCFSLFRTLAFSCLVTQTTRSSARMISDPLTTQTMISAVPVSSKQPSRQPESLYNIQNPNDSFNPTSQQQNASKLQQFRSSLTFASEVHITIIPRVDDSLKAELFYTESEINMMRCESKMLSIGLDPENFDWKSMR